ncbi:MAG: YihY/virulence factor BrkB family protein [Chloroflexi bacterium]|nr:YihY/virulence factor BrkB family protein [Chloroflexota bacterium]
MATTPQQERVWEQPVAVVNPLAAGLGTGGKAFVVFCARATQQFLTNNSMQMAAAVAFYSFFSIFPLSILIILSFDLFVNQTAVQNANLVRALATFIPVSQDVIADAVRTAADSKAVAAPPAIVGLVWGSTGVFATLRKGINTAWNIRSPRAWVKERIIDLSITFGAGMLFLGLLLTTTVVRSFAETDVEDVGFFTGPPWLFFLSVLLLWVSFVVIYYFLPNRKVRLKETLFGGLIAAVSFEIALGAFFYYTRSRLNTSPIYGSFTSVAVLLGWLYVAAAIMLIGALICSIYADLVRLRIVSETAIWTFGIWPGIKHARRWMRRMARR